MILDERLEFADAAAVALNTSSQILGDVIDTGAFTKDLGAGETLYLVIQVSTVFGGAGNVTFQLYSHTSTTVNSGTSHYTTGALAYTVYTAGYTIAIALPAASYAQYLGIYETTSGNLTSGAVNIFLTKDVSRWRAYSDQDPGAV